MSNNHKLMLFCMLLVFLMFAGLFSVLNPGKVESVINDESGSHGVPDGKWRIGYCETDPFFSFAGTFYGLLEGLYEMGLISEIEDIPYKFGQEDSRIVWEWLVNNDTGPYIEFVEDAYYSFYDEEEGTEELLLTRLEEEKDLDMMIAMGTYPGLLLSTDSHDVPVLVFSTSNAVSAGIIESEEDSGREHIWAHMDPGRDRRMVEVFCDLFDFEKMGMVYEDSDIGRLFAAVDEVELLSHERNFKIARRFVDEPSDPEDRDRYYSELSEAYNELSREVDAFYLSVSPIEGEKLEELLAPFYERNIPVFSQLGGEEVRYGAVASVARVDFRDIGLFGADIIHRVLQGESPQSLPQVYMETPRIAVNFEAAERVGYMMPFEVLLVADQVYLNIE